MRPAVALAIGVQILVMALVLVPPLMIRTSGDTLYLATEKMDPRALFRGDYVILGYRLAQGILTPEQEQGLARSTPVYVTVTRDRPARFVAVGLRPPEPALDHACLVGRIRGSGGAVDFPQIAQYFVPEGTGRVLEQARGDNLLAKVKVTDDCRAVLVGLEPL